MKRARWATFFCGFSVYRFRFCSLSFSCAAVLSRALREKVSVETGKFLNGPSSPPGDVGLQAGFLVVDGTPTRSWRSLSCHAVAFERKRKHLPKNYYEILKKRNRRDQRPRFPLPPCRRKNPKYMKHITLSLLCLSALTITAIAQDGADADNTKKNQRDRSGETQTSGDQSNRSEDVKLTAAIRRAVVADDSLSATAKNIKIITANET